MSNLSSCVSTTTAVSRSGRIRSNARSGPSTTVKSTARSSPCASESNVSVSVNLGARSICALDQSELSSIQALEEDVDLAAAREADAQRLIVGDAVGEQPRLARDDHLARLDCDVALDTAAGDRPAHLSSLRDRELRADGTRRRAPRGDDRCDRDLLAALTPALDLVDDLLHAACLRSMPARTVPSASRLARSCPETRRSTWANAARIPPVSGSYSGCPFNGFTQTIANAWPASRAISDATSAGSPRSQPSESTTTTAPRVSARRPHSSLYALSDSPIRVPPDQSSTRLEAAASAVSALRVASSDVRRVSRVPNAKVSTPRPEPRAACR